MRILLIGMMEREGIAICMLSTPHGALNGPKITTAQISIVAFVVNRIMVKLAHKLSISNVDNFEGNTTKWYTFLLLRYRQSDNSRSHRSWRVLQCQLIYNGIRKWNFMEHWMSWQILYRVCKYLWEWREVRGVFRIHPTMLLTSESTKLFDQMYGLMGRWMDWWVPWNKRKKILRTILEWEKEGGIYAEWKNPRRTRLVFLQMLSITQKALAWSIG